MGNEEERNTISFCLISGEGAKSRAIEDFELSEAFEVNVGMHQ